MSQWNKGHPDHVHSSDWFIAETMHGGKVCLKALPKGCGFDGYDYTTADDTYMLKENVKRWMPFPDGDFYTPLEFKLKTANEAQAVRIAELVHNVSSLRACLKMIHDKFFGHPIKRDEAIMHQQYILAKLSMNELKKTKEQDNASN